LGTGDFIVVQSDEEKLRRAGFMTVDLGGPKVNMLSQEKLIATLVIILILAI
jgi:hypothetical protein